MWNQSLSFGEQTALQVLSMCDQSQTRLFSLAVWWFPGVVVPTVVVPDEMAYQPAASEQFKWVPDFQAAAPQKREPQTSVRPAKVIR